MSELHSPGLIREMQEVVEKIEKAQRDVLHTETDLRHVQDGHGRGYTYSENDTCGLGNNTDKAFTMQWLLKERVSSHTVDLLIKEDCCELEVLELCSDLDFDHMGLSIGQKRVLQAALRRRPSKAGSSSRQDKTSTMYTRSDPGQFPCNFFLGMGVRGSQTPYMDICEFVSVRSPYEGVSDSRTLITNKSDGSFEVKPQSVGNRITLDKVAVSQWVEANTLIMNQLYLKGVSIQSYMGYTIMISQLMQKYEWLSVLLFDREYRKMQANLGFEWGTDQSHLRDVLLIPKISKEGKGTQDNAVN